MFPWFYSQVLISVSFNNYNRDWPHSSSASALAPFPCCTHRPSSFSDTKVTCSCRPKNIRSKRPREAVRPAVRLVHLVVLIVIRESRILRWKCKPIGQLKIKIKSRILSDYFTHSKQAAEYFTPSIYLMVFPTSETRLVRGTNGLLKGVSRSFVCKIFNSGLLVEQFNIM